MKRVWKRVRETARGLLGPGKKRIERERKRLRIKFEEMHEEERGKMEVTKKDRERLKEEKYKITWKKVARLACSQAIRAAGVKNKKDIRKLFRITDRIVERARQIAILAPKRKETGVELQEYLRPVFSILGKKKATIFSLVFLEKLSSISEKFL